MTFCNISDCLNLICYILLLFCFLSEISLLVGSHAGLLIAPCALPKAVPISLLSSPNRVAGINSSISEGRHYCFYNISVIFQYGFLNTSLLYYLVLFWPATKQIFLQTVSKDAEATPEEHSEIINNSKFSECVLWKFFILTLIQFWSSTVSCYCPL